MQRGDERVDANQTRVNNLSHVRVPVLADQAGTRKEPASPAFRTPYPRGIMPVRKMARRTAPPGAFFASVARLSSGRSAAW